MPRIIFGADAPPLPTDLLIRSLAEELSSPSGGPLPLIIERHVRGTHSRHVWVIWDRWDDLNEEERSDIIRRAYITAEGVEVADHLAIASGVRPREAVLFGLVPYRVATPSLFLKRRPEYAEIIKKEAKNTILGAEAKELRYPTEDEARRAVERLEQDTPGTSWAVHRDEDDES